MKKWVNNLFGFGLRKFLILVIIIISLFILSLFFKVGCIYASSHLNSSYIYYQEGDSIRCVVSENFEPQYDQVLCENEECADLVYNDLLYCVDLDCEKANRPSLIITLLMSVSSLYLLIIIFYSIFNLILKKHKKKK